MMGKALSILAIALIVSGCSRGPDELDWWEKVENDPQVRLLVMEQCLSRAKGPAKTHYNDLDEYVEACDDFALKASRYCARQCQTGELTRDDVRAILPTPPPSAGTTKRN